ncbi:MAG: immune inhibitor A domain-containing protein [Actinomycetota bacterium]
MSRRFLPYIAAVIVLAMVVPAIPSGRSSVTWVKGLGPVDLKKARAAMAAAVKKVGAPPKALNDYFNAVPYSMGHAQEEVATRTQPNGGSFPVRIRDIGEGGGQMTLDGHLVVKSRDGWWRYATYGAASRFKATKSVVLRDKAPKVSLATNMSASMKKSLAEYNTNREAMRNYLALRNRSIAAAAAAAGEPVVFKVPVILLQVNNQPFQPDSLPQKFQDQYSGIGKSPTGTVTEVYLEQSFGKMLVEFDVYGPYNISISNNPANDCWYGTDNGPLLGGPILPPALDDVVGLGGLGLGGYGAKGMALEGVPQADLDGVDFAQYDGDGDRYIDFLMTIHSGEGAESSGDGCDVHSHYFAGLGSAAGEIVTQNTGVEVTTPSEPTPITTDGVMVGPAMTVPEIDSAIGVVAHELMHALGEPDYYGDAGTVGLGEWDLGAGGSWLGIPAQTNPIHFNPVMKINFGWVEPRLVTGTSLNQVLRPRAKYPEVVMIPTRVEAAGSDGAAECDKNPIGAKPGQNNAFYQPDGSCLAEGFLIENFSRSAALDNFNGCVYSPADFDKQAYASGLAIWYWDFTNYQSLGNNNVLRPMLDLKEFDRRDDTQDLALGITRGDPLDLFWGDPVGISGATQLSPAAGELQSPSGSPFTTTAAPGTTSYTPEWTTPKLDNGIPMSVTLDWATSSIDDWDLTVERKAGGEWVEAGSDGNLPATGPENVTFVFEPGATYRAATSNFASASPQATTTIVYDVAGLVQLGPVGTRNNVLQQTGWQITNIRPNGYRGLAHDAESGPITFDIIKHTTSTFDVSGDFLRPTAKTAEPIIAGKELKLGTWLYNHGIKAVSGATITLYDSDPAKGAEPVATLTKDLGSYARVPVVFDYTPKAGLNELYVKTTVAGDLVPGNDVVRTELNANRTASADVLIVDNDRHWEREDAVEAVLQGLGVSYHVVEGEPSAATMAKYKAVTWITTTVSGAKGIIPAKSVAAITQYLDGGGKFWFMSSRAMQYAVHPDVAAPKFMPEYFGIEAVSNMLNSPGTAIRKLSGGAGDLQLGYVDGRPYLDYGAMATDGVTVIEGEEEIQVFPKGKAEALYNHSVFPENVIASRVTGAKFRTVYSFPVDMIRGAAGRVAFAKEVLSFFGIQTGTVKPAARAINVERFEHVQYREGWTVTAGATAPEGVESVSLLYRPQGGFLYETLKLKPAGSGMYDVTIPAAKVANNGIEYFVRMVTKTGAVVETAGGEKRPNVASAAYGSAANVKYGKCGAAQAAAVKGAKFGGSVDPAPSGLPATGVGSSALLGVLAMAGAAITGGVLRRKRLS